MLNKKGDVGETITWIVATIAVVLILILSFFISGFIAKGKNLFVSNDKIETRNEYTVPSNLDEGLGTGEQVTIFSSNLFESKTNLAFNLKKMSNEGRKKVLDRIKEVKKYE